MSHVGCVASTTQAQRGGVGGIRKNPSDVSGRRIAQADGGRASCPRQHGDPGTSATVTQSRSGASATSDWNCGGLFFFSAQDDVQTSVRSLCAIENVRHV